MNLQPLASVLTAGALALGATATINQPTYAQSTTFYCGASGGVPATIASTPRGDVAVIRWIPGPFDDSGYTPERRCEEVSGRFQTYKNQGVLNYITTGRMNGQNVVCVSSANGGACAGLLFTLKPRENASRVVQRLFDIRAGAAGPLNESSGRYYLDINNFLNTAPVQGGAASPSAKPNTSAPANSEPSSQPGGGGAVW